MADQNDSNTPRDDEHQFPSDSAQHGEVPIEDEGLEEEEAPRRAASAQFIVDSEVGSEAALREAMDPANQSLADALRLSFRVLQIVIVVLIILFFGSGLKTVDEGQSGVLTRFGEIVPVKGQDVLEPGLHFSAWPYPIGDFVILDVENRSVSIDTTFWPYYSGTTEDAIDSASVNHTLSPRPDRGAPRGDGYLLTRDVDIAHLRMSADYDIESEGLLNYIRNVRDQDSDQLVELALRRAAIHVAARSGLTDVVDRSDTLRFEIMESAQEVLDGMGAGIRIVNVSMPDARAAFAIQRTFREQQDARVEAEQAITRARQDAEQILIDAAGERYRDLIRLIEQYEQTLVAQDYERSEEVLATLSERFDRGDLSGEVARIIQFGHAYRSHVESTLGNEARRFASLLPAFKEHPELVIRQRWLDTYSYVLSRRDAEIWKVPSGVGLVKFQLAGLHEVRELRQRERLDRREREARETAFDFDMPFLRRAEDIRLEGPDRQMQIEDGRMRGRGRN